MILEHNKLNQLIFFLLGETLFYLLDYVTLRSEKKMGWRQIGEKFPTVGMLLFPWKYVMLLFCQIVNICNYEVLFDKKKKVTCKYYSSSVT